jgi:hypothetical protein
MSEGEEDEKKLKLSQILVFLKNCFSEITFVLNVLEEAEILSISFVAVPCRNDS